MRNAVDRTWVSSDDSEKLRGFFDGKDKFMTTPNVVSERVGRRLRPEGLDSQQTIVDFLKKHFPYANRYDSECSCSPCRSRKWTNERANCPFRCRECRETTLFLKWYNVIWHSWFHAERDHPWTAKQIEEEFHWKHGTVGYIVQQVRRAWAGVRLDGKPRTGRRRGRPRKPLEGIIPEELPKPLAGIIPEILNSLQNTQQIQQIG
jgi:hypothetical protein